MNKTKLYSDLERENWEQRLDVCAAGGVGAFQEGVSWSHDPGEVPKGCREVPARREVSEDEEGASVRVVQEVLGLLCQALEYASAAAPTEHADAEYELKQQAPHHLVPVHL
ncbi:hypothetical protein V5799_007661 [Amblyomma americanum]|uniref:Uncharacterized protein n=1 Tax=Amblyomma americanum TaxID=6943 RepID=A0AAQ4FH54_AMBAM